METLTSTAKNAIVVYHPDDISILQNNPNLFHHVYPGLYLCAELPYVLCVGFTWEECFNLMNNMREGFMNLVCSKVDIMAVPKFRECWGACIKDYDMAKFQPSQVPFSFFWLEDLPNSFLEKSGALYTFLTTCVSDPHFEEDKENEDEDSDSSDEDSGTLYSAKSISDVEDESSGDYEI